MAQFEIIEVEATPYLYVERSTSHEPGVAAKTMGAAFDEVWRFMKAREIAPAGGALTVYTAFGPDRIDFRTGFTIARDDIARASHPVRAGFTPAGRVAHGTHLGPYSGISRSFDEMHGFLDAAGATWTDPRWEVYVNSPDQVPEDALLTEIYQTLAD